MASTSRKFVNPADWDPMREDFDNSNYENQNADDNSGDFVKLNHRRLYVTSIPLALNDDALRAAFAKYGTLTEVYVNKDPAKRYALINFETAAEARVAMMKLNKVEPLKLRISVAHDTQKRDKKKDNQNSRSNVSIVHSSRERDYDTTSNSSRNKNRKTEDLTNGDNLVGMEDGKMDMGDDMGLVEPDLQLELDRLKLESLRLQQEELACQKRMLIKQAERRALVSNQPSNRCVLPNGRVVVKNITEGIDRRDPENFAAAAGDSLKIPGLQRAASRACVSCGGQADSFCARCGVTPYCSQRCQRRDWPARHSAVCHNLARLNEALDVNGGVVIDDPIAATTPMRRPYSPARESPREAARDHKDDLDDSKKFTPPGHHPKPGPRSSRDGQRPFNRPDGQSRQGEQSRQLDRPPRQFNKPDMQKPMRRPQLEDEDWGSKGRPKRGQKRATFAAKAQYLKEKTEVRNTPDYECWDAPKAEPKPNVPAANETVTSPNKPPMKETPANKPANQETPPPARTPIRTTATPQAAVQKEVPPASKAKPPADVIETRPASKLVPKNCVIETLSVGDKVLLQVDSSAKECEAGNTGFVCVSIGDSYIEAYQTLCESYTVEDSSPVPATPGQTVSLYNTTEEAWYRARVLSSDKAALLDASKVVAIDSQVKLAALPAAYALIPEFCCILQADVNIGDNFTCTVVEKSARGFKVSLELEGGATREGEVSRWLPAVCYPAPPTPQPAGATNSKLMVVSRPAVTHGSIVLLVHFTSGVGAGSGEAASKPTPTELYVRPADARAVRAFEAALQDTMHYGLSATPLSEPPRAGQYVVGKFSDGVHYRALVRRTSVARNKYQLEYLEFGNLEVTQLENLYACPPALTPDQTPVLTSRVVLHTSAAHPLTPAAETYLEALKEDTELVLTLPNGEKTAPSGAEVVLTVVKNKDCVNRRVEELCTPEWLALQQKGGDVVDVEPVMYSDLTWLELPPSGGDMTVLDVSSLDKGLLNACPANHPHMAVVLGSLTQRMNAYCQSELGREPYLPKVEEVCLAQLPPYEQWFRAVVVSHEAGAAEADVNYIDYGNLERVPVTRLRKMLREFVHGLPALASTLIVRGFPKNPSGDQLMRAAEYMKLNDEGQGSLRVSNCQLESPDVTGLYHVDAPGLLEAMKL